MTPSPLPCAQCRVRVHHLVSLLLFRPRPAACQQSKEQKENKNTKCKQDARQDGKGGILVLLPLSHGLVIKYLP